jgi:hypothetical protein
MTPPMFYEDSLGAKMADAWNRLGSADDELIEDPEALETAQREGDQIDPEVPAEPDVPDWVPVFGPARLSGLMRIAGATAFELTAALDSAEIPHAWDPYPPEEMPAFRPYYGAIDRPFTLLVPRDRFEVARAALADFGPKQAPSPRPVPSLAIPPSPSPLAAPWPPEHKAWWEGRRVWGWFWVILTVGPALVFWLIEKYTHR